MLTPMAGMWQYARGRHAQNARYIGELTKFGLFSASTTFAVLKTLLDDFTPGSIETLCHLLETCGRFLHRTTTTAQRMSNMVGRVPGRGGACSGAPS